MTSLLSRYCAISWADHELMNTLVPMTSWVACTDTAACSRGRHDQQYLRIFTCMGGMVCCTCGDKGCGTVGRGRKGRGGEGRVHSGYMAPPIFPSLWIRHIAMCSSLHWLCLKMLCVCLNWILPYLYVAQFSSVEIISSSGSSLLQSLMYWFMQRLPLQV